MLVGSVNIWGGINRYYLNDHYNTVTRGCCINLFACLVLFFMTRNHLKLVKFLFYLFLSC